MYALLRAWTLLFARTGMWTQSACVAITAVPNRPGSHSLSLVLLSAFSSCTDFGQSGLWQGPGFHSGTKIPIVL